MESKARDLIAAGWPEGRRLGPALRRARALESTGLARADVLTALEAEFPKQLAVILPRYEPAPLTGAVEADTPEEAANVATARQRMTELLHVPVVKRGVIMPDACPTGGGRAAIPVGGAIEVENAIIPDAHSADDGPSPKDDALRCRRPTAWPPDDVSRARRTGVGYKDATKVKTQIEQFGLAAVVGEIQPQGGIMAGAAPEPHWVRARREKRASHKAARRQGSAEVGET